MTTRRMFSFITRTWNPLGGECPHKCKYCLPEGTLVLMGDFSQKPIEDVTVEDTIIGLKTTKTVKRFTRSKVTETMKRIGKTIIVETERGGKLECTPEHMLMGSTENRHGIDWKQAKAFSPYQIVRYIGEPAPESEDYLKGWLTGYADGDGCFFEAKDGDVTRLGFEAVSVDANIRQELKRIAAYFGIHLRDGTKHVSKNNPINPGAKYPMVFTRAAQEAEKLRALVRFTKTKSNEFYWGYVGGIIDAEGSTGKYIRIGQSETANPQICENIQHALATVKIPFTLEEDKTRVLGGIVSKLKILWQARPKSAKRDNLLLGASIKNTPVDTISSLKKGTEKVVYNLETECENFIANGFVVHNCYAQGERGLTQRYCMKKYQGPPRIIEHELKRKFRDYDVVFVADMTDLFAEAVPSEMITTILENILARKEAVTYFFLTKNPARYKEFLPLLNRINCILGCTLETNREANYGYWSKAPKPKERLQAFSELDFPHKFLSIEPIMAFDFEEFFVEMILNIPGLEAVAVGYDNHGAQLPEPWLTKTDMLIGELRRRFTVYVKTLREKWKAA